ncbi:MAG: PHP domain-containing protein [Clostridia bacterium]|nr:PHP domain-containing protein [Clostridia bacterium]
MIDLHVHTIYSDGEHTPLEVLDICNERGVSAVAITDHNSMQGSKEAVKRNPYKGVTVIPGIELSARYDVKGANLHILGYNIDLYNETLNNVTNAVMQDNVMRLESLVRLLKEHYNLSFKEKDLMRVYESIGNIGRPDIAKLCVEYGYTETVHEAFEKYFNPVDDKIAKRRVEFTDKSCIEYIRNAGGIACLAHPIELMKEMDDLKSYIKLLMSYGLEAIEVYQSKHSESYSRRLLDIVNEFGLLYSVGSDYHGPVVTPDIELGYGHEHNLHIQTATILSRF